MPPIDEAAIVLLDEGAIIRYWNPGAELLFGHVAADLLGTPLEALIPPAYQRRHRDGFAAAVARGATKLQVPDGPVAYLPLRCADGAYRRFPGRQVVLRDPAGAIAAVVGVFTRTVVTDAFVPSLYPIEDERGDGDMVVG
jgi:PAS domain S-box-containing protein